MRQRRLLIPPIVDTFPHGQTQRDAPITIVGDARDLVGFKTSTFDAVLCLGPLYHLQQEDDRNQVIRECIRVLKESGVAFLGFISKYAPISDLAKRNPAQILERRDILHQFIRTGIQEYQSSHAGWTDAYYVDPLEIRSVMAAYPMTEIALAGVEGMVAQSEDKIYEQTESVFKAWADFTYETAQEKSVMASSEHILYIGRKGHPTADGAL